jgi:hypothetical protein
VDRDGEGNFHLTLSALNNQYRAFSLYSSQRFSLFMGTSQSNGVARRFLLFVWEQKDGHGSAPCPLSCSFRCWPVFTDVQTNRLSIYRTLYITIL